MIDRYALAGSVAPEALLAVLTDPSAAPTLDVAGPPLPQGGTYPLVLAVTDFP